MRKLDTESRANILTALVEGCSIASTCRMFGVNKITVLRLLADAGTLAAQYHDLTVCNIDAKRVEVDEIWAFVGAKQKNASTEKKAKLAWGDAWTWTAIDADSKLLITYIVGTRDASYALDFVRDLKSRLSNRIQLTSDGYGSYMDAVKKVFGDLIDYAQLIKDYGKEPGVPAGRYSPPVCLSAQAKPITGNPDPDFISTSYVERQNLTMRMRMRRFTRLTNAFSKKIENHQHAVALHYFHYNFIRKHMTIKTTPAVMAGIADKVWTMTDFVKMLEREEELLGGRLTDYKPAASKLRQ